MNVERIRELADIIEKQPHTKISDESGFNMGEFAHVCGTPACICGWANHVKANGAPLPRYRYGYEGEARDWLGIDRAAAYSLFRPDIFDEGEWSYITPTHAAAVLRHLADTGKVDWSVGAPVEVA